MSKQNPMKKVFIPSLRKWAKFHNRHQMRRGHPTHRLRASFPAATLPIDWTKGGTLSYPMDDNDTLGDCMVAAALHADNTFTGNVGTESTFSDAVTKAWYLALSGGDNGLDEGTLLTGWTKGLDGVADANILDHVDIDPTDAVGMQASMKSQFGVLFMLAVPDAWVNNFITGGLWDAGTGIKADENNGHGVWLSGCDAAARWKVQTWGTYCWMTQAGVSICDPSAFVVFSLRMFNAQGIAADGQTYDQKAAIWKAATGRSLPPNPFVPGPTPTPTPGPTPTPTPTPPVSIIAEVDAAFAALEKQYANHPVVVRTLKTVNAMVDSWLKAHGYSISRTPSGAVPPIVLTLIDDAFQMAIAMYPQYTALLTEAQSLVVALLSGSAKGRFGAVPQPVLDALALVDADALATSAAKAQAASDATAATTAAQTAQVSAAAAVTAAQKQATDLATLIALEQTTYGS